MKDIPTALQAHLDTLTTTMCYLLKITPKKEAAFGVTSLDISITYDDGGGEMEYQANPGLNQSALEANSGLEVNNSESMLLLTVDLTKQKILAGVLDYATFQVYRINWKDKSQGHYLKQSGTTGVVRTSNDLAGVIELRSDSQILKQNFVELYSISCRATFGTQVGEEMFPCYYDATSLWSNGTVTAQGSETDRAFGVSPTPAATGPNGALPFDYALIEFLTGNNAGLTVETEAITGDLVGLRFAAAYPIEVGDTYRIRPDCRKRYSEDCIGLYSNGENFRGEPWIPLTEESPAQFPGANVPGVGAPPVYPGIGIPIPPTPPDSTDIAGAISWQSYFGVPFLSPSSDITKVIPAAGQSVWFTVPDTTDSWRVVFSNVSVTSVSGTRTGALNTTVGDFTTAPTHTWGTGGGFDGGINFAGQDKDLIPGYTYILNFRNDTPASNNQIRMQVIAQQQ